MRSSDKSLDEPQEFERLFEQTHQIVFRYIFGLSGGPLPQVEDLTAETYFRAWRSRRSFKGNDYAALSWLLTIARNLVFDVFRHRKLASEAASIDDPAIFLVITDSQASPEAQVEMHDQLSILWKLIGILEPQQREMLVLRYMLSWPVWQIAQYLGIMENTVSVNLRRILEKLRKNWPVEN